MFGSISKYRSINKKNKDLKDFIQEAFYCRLQRLVLLLNFLRKPAYRKVLFICTSSKLKSLLIILDMHSSPIVVLLYTW